MQHKEVLEMRGMKRNEIMDYFHSLNEAYKEPDQFIGDKWLVTVNEETPIKLGSIIIPSTIVEFQGETEVLEGVLTNFRLRFLTAGG